MQILHLCYNGAIMDKKTWIIIAVIIAVFAGLIGYNMAFRSPDDSLAQIFPASEESGNLPENIDGDPNAPILIFDYSDYQCEHCASFNNYLNQLVEEYDGKVAVVYRTFVQNYHANGTAAASAANAAAIQGYWKEYKDFLFANQNEWFYSDAATRQKQFEQYFTTVTDGKGDLAKFRADMLSDEVAAKIAFDRKLAEERNLTYTPYIDLGTTHIKETEMNANFLDIMREKINKLLENQE